MTKNEKDYIQQIKSKCWCSTCICQKSINSKSWKPRCSHPKLAKFLKNISTPLIGCFPLCPNIKDNHNQNFINKISHIYV